MLHFWLALLLLFFLGVVLVIRELRRRGYHRWLGRYLRESGRRRDPRPDEAVHVLLCLADHWEPKADGASPERAWARVRHWVAEYPRQFAGFRDSDGRPPRHTFFFPIEEYEPEFLDALAELCRAGFGEVEVHLHHQKDTAKSLQTRLESFKELLARRHGLLSRRRDTGELAYGFIHGNWALCNADPDWCGVDSEISVLLESGCYADFTFPSAPDPTQPAIVNRIYYARDLAGRPRSYDYGVEVAKGPPPPGSLMLFQGPLLLDWSKRKGGLVPRLENGCVQASQPPSLERLDKWLRARIQVPGRPDWFFVKLYAHGAEEISHEALLGEPMRRFHEGLARRALGNPRFHYHYVTAREMYNLAKAAEAGWKGTVADARDYLLVANHAPAEKKIEEPQSIQASVEA